MINKVIILRALPWGSDSRAERWAKIYSDKLPLFGIWGYIQNDNVKSITSIVRKPENKLLIALGYIWFSLMTFVFVLRNAKKNDTVVFIDLETILFGFLAAFIKKADIHYDMADPFYLVKPVPFRFFWKLLEKFYIYNTKVVTAPHLLRFKIFFEKIQSNMKVVENVPIYENKLDIFPHFSSDNKIIVGYFGGLEANYRGLENLAKLVVNDNRLKLVIAGSGTLFNFFVDLSKKCDRIIFKGKYDIQDLPTLVKNIDVYFAYYSELKPLHKIASPNKFYEHLFFGKPILTSVCIPQSESIQKFNTGWCIENDEDALINWKNSLFNNNLDFLYYFYNCRNLWLERYEKYYEELLFNKTEI